MKLSEVIEEVKAMQEKSFFDGNYDVADAYNYCLEMLEEIRTEDESINRTSKNCNHEWESVSAVKCEKCGMIIED